MNANTDNRFMDVFLSRGGGCLKMDIIQGLGIFTAISQTVIILEVCNTSLKGINNLIVNLEEICASIWNA